METGHKNHKAVQGENLVCYPLLICPAPFWNPENDAWQQGLVVTGAKQLPKLFTWKLCQHSIRSVIRMMQRYFPCHLQVTLLNVQPLLHLCKMDSPHTGNRPLSYKALGQVFLFVCFSRSSNNPEAQANRSWQGLSGPQLNATDTTTFRYRKYL